MEVLNWMGQHPIFVVIMSVLFILFVEDIINLTKGKRNHE